MQQYSAFVDAHEEWQQRLRLANERVEKAKNEERYWREFVAEEAALVRSVQSRIRIKRNSLLAAQRRSEALECHYEQIREDVASKLSFLEDEISGASQDVSTLATDVEQLEESCRSLNAVFDQGSKTTVEPQLCRLASMPVGCIVLDASACKNPDCREKGGMDCVGSARSVVGA